MDQHNGSDYSMHHSLVPQGTAGGSCVEGYGTGNGDGSSRAKRLDTLPDVEYTKKEEIKRKMSALSHEQCLDILAKASVAHPDVQATIRLILEASPASRRLMLRNIAFCTTEAVLRGMLERYGEVEDFCICKDRSTGSSKGYGFATYTTVDSVERVLTDKLVVDGRSLMVKLASDPITNDSGTAESGGVSGSFSDASRCKLFVRNLSDTITDAALKDDFSSFGAITEGIVVKNNEGESKGFGFVTFARAADAQKALQIPQRIIAGRMAFVSLAAPQTSPRFKSGNSGGGMAGVSATPGGFGYDPWKQNSGYSADRNRYHGGHASTIGGVPYSNPHTGYNGYGRGSGNATGMYGNTNQPFSPMANQMPMQHPQMASYGAGGNYGFSDVNAAGLGKTSGYPPSVGAYGGRA